MKPAEYPVFIKRILGLFSFIIHVLTPTAMIIALMATENTTVLLHLFLILLVFFFASFIFKGCIVDKIERIYNGRFTLINFLELVKSKLTCNEDHFALHIIGFGLALVSAQLFLVILREVIKTFEYNI